MAATKASRKAPKANPSIKKPKVYEALREQGASPEKAARISNAQAKSGTKGPDAPARKGGEAKAYEAWTRGDLYERAKDIGIEGVSRSTKAEIIHALRSH